MFQRRTQKTGHCMTDYKVFLVNAYNEAPIEQSIGAFFVDD